MGRFARIFKCICTVVALGILVTGLAAQTDKVMEVTASSAIVGNDVVLNVVQNNVLSASITEDYTDCETPHATIRRGGFVTAVEVSKESAGGNSGESIARRMPRGVNRTLSARFLSLLTMVMAAATISSSISRPAAHAEGNAHSAERTIISYIHSQGNFIG